MFRKKRKAKIYTQCDYCQQYYCTEKKQEECAYLTIKAIAKGESHDCDDFKPGYWEQFCM